MEKRTALLSSATASLCPASETSAEQGDGGRTLHKSALARISSTLADEVKILSFSVEAEIKKGELSPFGLLKALT